MSRFSANLGVDFLWPGRPLLQRIEAVARAGFKAVELHFPYDVPAGEVKAACAAGGLKLLNINTNIGAGPDGHRGLAAVPGREADFAQLADQAITYAAAAGASGIHVMAGNVPAGDVPAGAEVLVKNLGAMAKRAEALGLTLLLEALNTRDRPGAFYSKIESVVDVIERVGAANVKLMFDVYHVAVEQGDVITRLRTHFDRIGHVQIAAVPSRAEPDEGEIAYRAIFDELDVLGYDGWIGCEYRPRGDTDAGLSWVKRLGVSL